MEIDEGLVRHWAALVEATQGDEGPMDQAQLERYINDTLGGRWRDVTKVAWVKVVEKAVPGRKYETVTRDEDNGEWKETSNTAKDGDFLVQNAYGSGDRREPDDAKDPSRWLLRGDKIKKNYQVDGEVEVGGCYAPVPNTRKGIRLDRGGNISFVASWGEQMNAKEGDWLVKAGDGDIYRIDKVVFDNTYKVG